MQYLYKAWNLDTPKLIISVTGGAQNFTIDARTKEAFKKGLVKAAKTTNALIVSGGTNFGVMKLVGDAVAEDLHFGQQTVLGIATWGRIAFKDSLIV